MNEIRDQSNKSVQDYNNCNTGGSAVPIKLPKDPEERKKVLEKIIKEIIRKRKKVLEELAKY